MRGASVLGGGGYTPQTLLFGGDCRATTLLDELKRRTVIVANTFMRDSSTRGTVPKPAGTSFRDVERSTKAVKWSGAAGRLH
jgi:hypothetical protein